MSVSEDLDKLQNALMDLDSRLSQVESGNVVAPEEETLNGRLDRQRDERAQAVKDKRYEDKDSPFNMDKARPTSPKRGEEILQRQHSLPAQEFAAQNNQPVNVPALGGIIFYAYKGGKSGRINLAANSAFVPD